MSRLPPDTYGEPSNRWPWVALAAGTLVVVLAVAIFLFNRQNAVTINVQGTLTPNPVARAGTASPPPTLVPPTLQPSASLVPTATPAATPTPVPAPTQPPTPPPTQVGAAAPPTPPAQAPTAAPPVAGAVATGTSLPAAQAPTPTAAPTTPASPTPFAGQVANAGGLGNTRADLDAAYGGPTGETADNLVVYRKNAVEYHVAFAPDINGRSALVSAMPQPGTTPTPMALSDAQAAAHRLLPKDAQPPNPQPEGNDQFVVERYTSQTLAQALPPDAFSRYGGQPGQLMIVYAKDAQGRVTRWVLGLGNDANALLNAGR